MRDSLTAPNGLNFKKSIGNPESRLERVRWYLYHRSYVPLTKREILRDVFNKHIVDTRPSTRNPRNANLVSRSWGIYLFTYAVKRGLLCKFRSGRKVYYANPVEYRPLRKLNP